MSKVLVVGDLHAPFVHAKYLSFCKSIYKKYNCNKVVFAGDIVDNHALSYHESDPDLYSAGHEMALAKKEVNKWVKTFPKASICIGNHDMLPYRQAKSNGLPMELIKDYMEMWETPNWNWSQEFIIDDVLYRHSKGSGKNSAINGAIAERMSLVIGHLHSQLGVKFTASKRDRIFGMDSGCGIDIRARAFAYGQDFNARPIVGAGVVIDGKYPISIPMEL